MTTIYLMRHSKTFKPYNINNTDNLQIQNEKWPLSIEGEQLAKEKSEIEELKNFDIVVSSNYVRAISTAKYFTNNTVIIDESFNERRFGINDWNELPQDFEDQQLNDYNYKMPNGESLNEVLNRSSQALSLVLSHHKGQKILIVGHATAFTALLSKWCSITNNGTYIFNNQEIFDGKWNHCQTFKLEFDDNNNLINIKTIE